MQEPPWFAVQLPVAARVAERPSLGQRPVQARESLVPLLPGQRSDEGRSSPVPVSWLELERVSWLELEPEWWLERWLPGQPWAEGR